MTANGAFINLAMVNFNENEFTLDLAYVQPQAPRATVRARAITSPKHMKRLMLAIQDAVGKYEQRFGALDLGGSPHFPGRPGELTSGAQGRVAGGPSDRPPVRRAHHRTARSASPCRRRRPGTPPAPLRVNAALTRRETMSDTHDAGGRRLAVFAIAEGKGIDGKARWTRIGRAFDNQDGSINLLLNALPLGTDRLQVREEHEEDRPAAGRPAPRRAEVRGGADVTRLRLLIAALLLAAALPALAAKRPLGPNERIDLNRAERRGADAAARRRPEARPGHPGRPLEEPVPQGRGRPRGEGARTGLVRAREGERDRRRRGCEASRGTGPALRPGQHAAPTLVRGRLG